MQLFMKQDLDSIREDLGYDTIDDDNEDAILYQQGYDADVIEVEDDETFVIPKGYSASIVDDGETYYRLVNVGGNEYEKEEILYDLTPGKYQLDGNVIKAVKSKGPFGY